MEVLIKKKKFSLKATVGDARKALATTLVAVNILIFRNAFTHVERWALVADVSRSFSGERPAVRSESSTQSSIRLAKQPHSECGQQPCSPGA